VREELGSLILELSLDEQIDLVALTWLGKDDGQAADWEEVCQQATYAQQTRGRLSLRARSLAITSRPDLMFSA
jgi:hypothetical protein